MHIVLQEWSVVRGIDSAALMNRMTLKNTLTVICQNDHGLMGDGFCQNLCLCGEPRRCHSFYCFISSSSYARAQVSSIAIIWFSFPSCLNRSRLILHVFHRVHFCNSPNTCGTHFAPSLHIFKFFLKVQNAVNAEIPEYADNFATVQCLSSVKQCSVTATCTSVWADSGCPLCSRSTVATCPRLKAFTQCATVQ